MALVRPICPGYRADYARLQLHYPQTARPARDPNRHVRICLEANTEHTSLGTIYRERLAQQLQTGRATPRPRAETPGGRKIRKRRATPKRAR